MDNQQMNSSLMATSNEEGQVATSEEKTHMECSH